MITIIIGTNRQHAVSRVICRIYQELLTGLGQETNVVDLMDLPADFAFSALYENAGKNEEFNVYRQKMVESEKFVFIVPEYNGSFPGVLKAFVDGLAFPHSFRDKKCALVGLSSGVQGAGLALSHLTDIFNYCGMHVLALKPRLAQIEDNLDIEKETITNELYLELVTTQVQQLVDF